MDWLIEPFELAFQQRALIGGSLAAIALALVGTWVVIRGMTFLVLGRRRPWVPCHRRLEKTVGGLGLSPLKLEAADQVKDLGVVGVEGQRLAAEFKRLLVLVPAAALDGPGGEGA